MAQRPIITYLPDGTPVLDVSRLVHPVTIWQQGAGSPPTYDAAGLVVGWNPFTTGLASIEIMRGIDVIKAGQTTTQLYVELVMWWQPGILPNMHVTTDSGSTFVVQAVDNVAERNVVLRLNCLGLGANE